MISIKLGNKERSKRIVISSFHKQIKQRIKLYIKKERINSQKKGIVVPIHSIS